jgi:hypothetical protein
MISLTMLLLLTAFVTTILSAEGKAPLWVAVLLLVLIELLQSWPGR